jgi:hypothetical protein
MRSGETIIRDTKKVPPPSPSIMIIITTTAMIEYGIRGVQSFRAEVKASDA